MNNTSKKWHSNNPSNKNKMAENRSKNAPPDSYSLFTGGKPTTFAVYFNLAFDQVERFIKKIEPQNDTLSRQSIKLKTDVGYLSMKEYLWKGISTFQKNSGMVEVTDEDKNLVNALINKLRDIRNFQSHYWHDNECLIFEIPLREFVENAYQIALRETSRLEEVSDILFTKAAGKKQFSIFKNVRNKHFITQEGRLFFLSFFLHKGDMESLLQRTRGSKGNFLPEHKFKRKAYTYYCHREGATLFGNNIDSDNEILLPEAEQTKNYCGKTAFKILNFLKDKPAYYMNPEFTPILFEDNGQIKEVQCISDLLNFIKQKNLFGFLTFKEKDYSKKIAELDHEIQSKEKEATLKKFEDKQRIGYIDMAYMQDKKFSFEIAYPTLYRIALECFLAPDKTYVFEKTISSLIERRTFLFEKLNIDQLADKPKEYFESIEKAFFYPKEDPKEKEIYATKRDGKSEGEIQPIAETFKPEYYTIEELVNFPIGASAKILEKLRSWGDKLQKGKDGEWKARLRALNTFRSNTQKFRNAGDDAYRAEPTDKDPDPIIYHLADFHKGENEKPRTSDIFLSQAARFLSDFDFCHSWEFGFEDFRTQRKPGNNKNEERIGVKKSIVYGSKIPPDKRVKIMHNNLLFRTAKYPQASKPEDYFYFMLGDKALVYIFYWLIVQGKKSGEKTLDDFIQILCADLDKIADNGKDAVEELRLYEYREKSSDNKYASTLPSFKIVAKHQPVLTKQMLLDKVKRKRELFQARLGNIDQYSRNQLNDLILEAYKLFDFSNTLGKKYLRKNEYQLMSVVHYMLNQKGNKVKRYLDEKFKVNNTTLSKRLPGELYELIVSAASLKDLFTKVYSQCIEECENVESVLDTDLPLRLMLKNFPLLRLIAKTVNTSDSEEGKKNSYPFLPLYIDPNLVLKYFDPTGYKKGKYHPSKDSTKQQHTNLYKAIRDNSAYSGLLISEYYSGQWATLLQPLTPHFENAPTGFKTRIKKLSNWYNKYRLHQHTEDILLYIMSMQYFKEYNVGMYNPLKDPKKNRGLDVKSLFRKELVTEFRDNKAATGIYFSFFLHQTDDTFFKVNQSRFLSLAKHYQERRAFEIDYYSNSPEIAEECQKLPDGRKENPIPLGRLLQEKKIIVNSGLDLLRYIWNREEHYISLATEGMSAERRQKELVAFCSQHTGETDKPYIRFGDLCRKYEKELEPGTLISIRNEILHSNIPGHPYSAYISKNSTIGAGKEIYAILGITDRIGKDKALENPYLKVKNNDFNIKNP